jgi:hypothetical protein
MNKIPYIVRAVLAMLAGIGIVMLGVLLSRGSLSWQPCVGIILMLIGMPVVVASALLLMREQWVGGVAPGNYYTYACPHCGGSIHSRESINMAIDCPYCAKSFDPRR